MSLRRKLPIQTLLQSKSHFLFGPRSTGKSQLIEDEFAQETCFDLLDTSVYSALMRRPSALFEQINKMGSIVIIDEIQKLPVLLDEVQRLITKKKCRVLLTGSSARKLKRGSANLLGGRAREVHLFPLVSDEIPDFDLIRYLNRGGLPDIYLNSQDPLLDLKAYVDTYIKEEIHAEALVRKLDAFVRFLDVMALQSGEELHYQNISNDAQIPYRTVESYISILTDTLIGFELQPYLATKKRKAITRSKFYFFDVGVANFMAGPALITQKSESYGRALEHFCIQEIRAYLGYFNLTHHKLMYWRSTSGAEVDIIVGNQLAIEVKATTQVSERHLKGLLALSEEKLIQSLFVVSNDPAERVIGKIRILPIGIFLKELWSGKLI